MISITDMTLACLDEYNPSRGQLTRLAELLLGIGVDVLEISAQACKTIGALPKNGTYVIRIQSPDEMSAFTQFDRFICRNAVRAETPLLTCDIQANAVRDIPVLNRYGALDQVRITGLDDILIHDYRQAFTTIQQTINGRVELCPENKFYCATAIAVEWALNGGTNIASSFAGLNGKAPTEEVLLALHIAKRRPVNASLIHFPELSALLSEIIGVDIPKRKAVIGADIFTVESGIHIDGIMKNPQMYEPFPPEMVGNTRNIMLGKHSGKKAVALRLGELGLPAGEYDIAGILEAVKEISMEKHASVDDAELRGIIKNYRKPGGN